MDGQRFDYLTRSFVRTTSRRVTLRTLAAGLAAAVTGWVGHGPAAAQPAADACVVPGKSCRGGKRCCGRAKCRGNRCRCPGKTKPCGRDCIRKNQCCRHQECPANQRCRRNHTCGCASSQRRCRGRCIPRSRCCTNNHCPPDDICTNQHRCVAASCTENGDCTTGVCTCADPTPGLGSVPDVGKCQDASFLQTFATNADGWYAFFPGESGNPSIWAPPEQDDTITVAGGEARLSTLTDERFAVTTLGGLSDVFPAGGFDVSLDIFLDPADVAGVDTKDFAYAAAINSPQCEFVVDGNYPFVVGGAEGDYCVAFQDVSDGNDPCDNATAESIPEPGWYTFVHEFRRNLAGNLVITQRLLFGDLPVGSSEIEAVLSFGGNSFATVPRNDFDGLRIRNSRRTNR